MRRLTLIIAGFAAAAGFAPATAAARTVDITIVDIDYSKPAVSVKRGDRVRWTWRDPSVPHDVTSVGSRRFKSSATKETGTHTVLFRRAGTYRYVCSIHSNMRGRVVVR
jgi:plastocyanin